MKKVINFLYAISIILFAVILFIYPANTFNACKFGLKLWYNSVLPSLLPFMIITGLMLESSLIIELIHKLFSKIMSFLFKLPGVGSLPIILGMLCGFPMGAKLTVDLYDKKLLTLSETEKIMFFCNNCGPIFIINYVCLDLLGDVSYAPSIIFIQLLSALSVGFIFRNYKTHFKIKKVLTSSEQPVLHNSQKSISKVLNETIVNSAYNVINVGSFIVFYAVLLEILNLSGISNILNIFFIPLERALHLEPSLQGKLAIGLFEVSTGLSNVTTSSGPILQKLLLINIIINWGGFSVHSQTNSLLQKSNITLNTYIIGKFVQTIFCIIYTILFCFF